MVSTGQDFTIRIGQDEIIDIPITTDDANIDSWTMEAYFRPKSSSTLAATISATVPTPGVKTARIVLIDTTHTDAFTRGRYDFALWRTDAGFEKPLAEGTVQVVHSARTGTN